MCKLENSDYFVTAVLGQPFGVEGLIRISSVSGEISHIKKIKKMILRKDGETEFQVERFVEKGEKDDKKNATLYVKLASIDTPEDAKLWSGAEVLVLRENAAPLSAGEFYIEDLKGLSLVSDSVVLGEICDVIEGGGGFLLEVKLVSGKIKLIPFRDEFVGDVSLKERRIELHKLWILD